MATAPATSVLLTDDARLFKAAERTVLKRDKCRLQKAPVRELVARARTHPPDLILYAAGRAGALETLRALCSSRALSAVPVVVVDFSAAPDKETSGLINEAAGRRGGAVLLLTAPQKAAGRAQTEALASQLNELLEQHLQLKGRQLQRRPVTWKARCRGKGTAFSASTKDISMSGLFLRTGRVLPRGQRVEVHLAGGGAPDFKAVCEVVRRVDRKDGDLLPGVGLRFVEMAEGDRKTLQKVLQG